MNDDKGRPLDQVTPAATGRDPAAGSVVHAALDPTPAPAPRWVFEDHVALGVLILLGGVVFAQFLSRYAFNHSIGWTEEGARMLLVLLVFIGAAGAASRQGHIYVEILELVLPGRAKRWLKGFNHLLSAGFFAYVAWLAWQVGQRVWNSSMSTLPISKGWIYTIVAAALLLMAYRLARQGIHHWRGDTPS
ncbi:TRAP transporter small permease [Halomonas sp. 707D7]|uniref:TRAP transporter small permease n=2 Tax=unclassified Halomonas TaxID=2609666 RepID=UPI00209FE4D2|nr:TRAP transporter small permease [Halomonas sp. 707D7]MCP1315330.1 TRAP transporter small permease [Halomonas sp. 707D7]